MRSVWLWCVLGFACTPSGPVVGSGGTSNGSGGLPSSGGTSSSSGGTISAGGEMTTSGGSLPKPIPEYHPPPGFEDCKHAEVKAECRDGWCKLPPSCFVMGSPETEWRRGRDTENQIAVTLTHSIEIQQKELTRAEWESITNTSAPGPDSCTEPSCPVAMVSWWDAIHVANLFSSQNGLGSCYEPVNCTGILGKDLVCTVVAEPEKSIYPCEGYRLPTRAEAEYAARAGTISTFYSGNITPYADHTVCNQDPALDLIAWYCFNSGGKPHVGGELHPNGFGLYDLIGNLSEWSNEEQTYSSSPGGSDPRGFVGTSSDRLTFSPQYDSKSQILRTASLLSGMWISRAPTAGFRLVRTLDPKPSQE